MRNQQSLGDTPSDEFRKQLHELADWIADFREHIEQLRVAPNDKPGAIRAQLPERGPEEGERSRKFSPTSITSLSQAWCTGVTRCFSVTSAGLAPRREFWAKF